MLPRPSFLVDEWRRRESGLFAATFDLGDKKWLHERRQPDPVLAFAQGLSLVTLGLDNAKGLTVKVAVDCPTAADAGRVRAALPPLLAALGGKGGSNR